MDSILLFEYLDPTFDNRTTILPTVLATASPLASESAPSSLKKRGNKFRYAARDSLAGRMKIGRPGSRRYRHWENEFFLIKNLSETESEHESEFSDDWDESYAPSYGSFSVVFEDDNKEAWEPFVDITEEQQRILLALSDYDDTSKDECQVLSPSQTFALLRKRSQRTLKRHKHSQLLHRIDEIVFAYSNSLLYDDQVEFLRMDDTREEDGEILIFAFSEKFQRHLLHALCEFYDLVSYSVDMSEERVTVVHRREFTTNHRSSSVVQFLRECK